jgi:hypothetical protein
VHTLSGLNVCTKGRTPLVGRGAKKPNFVAESDNARFAVRAL